MTASAIYHDNLTKTNPRFGIFDASLIEGSGCGFKTRLLDGVGRVESAETLDHDHDGCQSLNVQTAIERGSSATSDCRNVSMSNAERMFCRQYCRKRRSRWLVLLSGRASFRMPPQVTPVRRLTRTRLLQPRDGTAWTGPADAKKDV